jgi:hypothetical protein
MRTIHFIPCLVICLFSFAVFGQVSVSYLTEELPTDTIFPSSLSTHTALKPHVIGLRAQKGMFTSRIGKKANPIELTPLIDCNFRASDPLQLRTGAGVSLEGMVENKWYYRMHAINGIGLGDSLFTAPSYFIRSNTSKYNYFDLRGRLSYSPNEVFNFQVGLESNFIGEGNRSMFLSDYGKPYPFGQIRTKFWRLEYTVLYQFFREENGSRWQMKNGATHHISFNAAKWLNIGIFETVIFQPKDTLLNRGFEVEYLNPVIFYRPQEYAIGSSDNVLIGLSFTAKYKKHAAYGQLIIDDFFLAEIKNKTGWWANKYGAQLGIKGQLKPKQDSYFYRIEYNFARPYTYSHLNSGQNYGNQGATLSHPYTGNFMEILGELKRQTNRWLFKAFFSYFLVGLDKDGFSYGSDLYAPYTNRPYEYNHYIGQGIANNGIRAQFTVSYLLSKYGRLNAFIENNLRYDHAFKRFGYFPMLGIRSQLWNDYRNY